MASLSTIARNYYTYMSNKNIKGLEQYLHPDVQFISPMSKMAGKDSVLGAAQGFMTIFDALEIRQTFENDHGYAMIVFDLICPKPIGTVRSATLMAIKENLIVKMELFFDASPFKLTK